MQISYLNSDLCFFFACPPTSPPKLSLLVPVKKWRVSVKSEPHLRADVCIIVLMPFPWRGASTRIRRSVQGERKLSEPCPQTMEATNCLPNLGQSAKKMNKSRNRLWENWQFIMGICHGSKLCSICFPQILCNSKGLDLADVVMKKLFQSNSGPWNIF